jgi:Leucine-rich repeat (LRR) protein
MKGNFISSLPKTIVQLINLKTLILCDNYIEFIPKNIYYLENLEELFMNNNKYNNKSNNLNRIN